MVSPALQPRALLQRQADVFKALAHPGRMAIVHALADGPLPASQLAEVAGCSAPTTSRHLSILRFTGVVRDERRGQQIFYHLIYPCVLGFAQCINQTDAGEANENPASTSCCN